MLKRHTVCPICLSIVRVANHSSKVRVRVRIPSEALCYHPAMTVIRRRIPWYDSPEGGGPLGRHVHHDERSKLYRFPTRNFALASTIHVRRVTAFNQGDIGSCVGNASLGVLCTDPFTLPELYQPNEETSVRFYSLFTKADKTEGSYPPHDTGTDGLTSGQVLKDLGLISGYTHTFTLNDALLALTKTPWITGFNWYSSMDVPDENGKVTITRDAYLRGGHEVEAFALDVDNRLIWFWNSWGPEWGFDGKFCMSWDTFARLLSEQGDVTVYAPLTAPAPTPVPQGDPDAVLASASRTWSAVTRFSKAGKAVAQWRTDRGL